MDYQDIIHFWFEQLTPTQWWRKDPELDSLIKHTYANIHHQAARGELSEWRICAEGSLAEIIILDQFSRNMYRNTALSFAYDGMALVLAQEAIRRQMNQILKPDQRVFLYLPFMHSESIVIHQQAMVLFSEPGMEENLTFEKKHADIINRFGRYPHRNKALGRKSTDDELEFMQGHPGF